MDYSPPLPVDQQALDRQNLVDILGYLSKAKDDCRDWHSQIENWRRLYDFRHYNTAPKPGETLYSDPTYTNVVDLAVGIILGNRVDWSAYSWVPSQPNTTDASKIEKYLAGLIDINSEREELLIPYEVLLNFVRDGCAVIYSPWDTEIADFSQHTVDWPDAETETGVRVRRQFDEPPLRIKVVDPLKVFPMQGGPRRWARIFKIDRMKVRDVEMQYRIGLRNYAHLDAMQKGLTEGELIDYWCWMRTPDEYLPTVKRPYMVFNAVLFDQEIVIPLRPMPGYDDLPYTVGFFKPVDREKPSGWGHSIMRPLETSLSLLEQNVNRRQRQVNVYSALPPVARLRANRPLQVDPAIGGVIQLNEGEDFGFPVWPGSAPDAQQSIDFLRSRTQQSGFSDVMFGAGSSQISGFALTQLGDQNRIRLTQPVEQLQLFWQNWAHKVMRMTANFARNSVVRVYGSQRGQPFMEQIIGGDLDGFRIKCKIKPVYPNEQSRRHAMATQVKGMISDETIMQNYLDIEQPDEEKKRVLAERAQTHPVMVQYMLLTTLKEMADTGDEAAQMTLDQLSQGGAPGQPGRPEEPRNMEQFPGMASPTGQPTPQERGMPAPGQSDQERAEGMANAAPGMDGSV